MRDLNLPGRSPVRAMNGMAATSSPLASIAAIDMLKAGGNAIDAAIAACAVQCVVEPESTGIGGDCFALISKGGSDEIVAFNGSGRAPMAATPAWYATQGIKKIERQTPHAVTVPGAVDAWAQLLADHGSKSLAEVLAPAIRHARDGYPITSRVSVDFEREANILRADPTSTRIFMPGGRTPAEGEIHRQPELAATMEHIAKHGRDGFYKGWIAEDLVAHLNSRGGLHTLDDFAQAKGEYVMPVSTEYRGQRIVECPPNGQGIIALELLNILNEMEKPAGGPLSAARLHAFIEATRLAYRDRNLYVADPRQVKVPANQLLDRARARRLAQSIDPKQRTANFPKLDMPVHADTVYLCVVDKDRNAVSFINSLFANFGSGLCGPKSGVMLQNRGMSFTVDPQHPNAIAPGKRPMHTIIPAMAVEGDRAVMPFGVMGGSYQAAGHAWFISNMTDYGLDIQEAMDLPRVFADPDGGVEMESGLPQEIVDSLMAMGHPRVLPDKPVGGSQAIRIDWKTGALCGGSDPRKDGCAIGY